MGIAADQAASRRMVGHGVDLVEHEQRRLLVDLQFRQHRADGGDLCVDQRTRCIGDVEQEVCLACFFQCGLEAGDQTVRQVADESHRVAEEHRSPSRQLPAAGAGVEGGEELVLGEHVGAREPVQERALPRIGVADERYREVLVAGGHLPLAAAMDRGQVVLEVVDPFLDEPAVHLELFFTRATHPDAHLQPRQVGPHPLEPWQGIFELGQFHGEPCLVGAGAGREDVENHLRTVEHLGLDFAFEVADLGRGEIVVEDDDVGIVVFDEHRHFGDLAAPEVGGLVGPFASLRHLRDHLRAGRLSEAAELVEWVLRIERGIEQHAHEYCALTLHAVGPLPLGHS